MILNTIDGEVQVEHIGDLDYFVHKPFGDLYCVTNGWYQDNRNGSIGCAYQCSRYGN